jgi:hypothetical protein
MKMRAHAGPIVLRVYASALRRWSVMIGSNDRMLDGSWGR